MSKRTNVEPNFIAKPSRSKKQSTLRLQRELKSKVVFNCGDENSVYRALEDAGAGLKWNNIRKIHEEKEVEESYNVKGFLQEFANQFNIVITLQYFSENDKKWKQDVLGDNSRKKQKKQKIAIREIQREGKEYAAVFFKEVMP